MLTVGSASIDALGRILGRLTANPLWATVALAPVAAGFVDGRWLAAAVGLRAIAGLALAARLHRLAAGVRRSSAAAVLADDAPAVDPTLGLLVNGWRGLTLALVVVDAVACPATWCATGGSVVAGGALGALGSLLVDAADFARTTSARLGGDQPW